MLAPSSIEPLEARIAPAAVLGPARLNGADLIGGEVLPAPVTYVWDGSASSDWFTAANWTPDGVPDADDTAILNINSTINLPTDTQVATFQQSAGTFTGPGVFTVLGSFDRSGGTMSGTGTTDVASGATLSISGPGAKALIQRTLSNGGMATWGQGSIDFSNGATFINKGSFVAQSDSVMRNVNGSNTFINEAEGTLTNNTGATVVEVTFSNAGTVNILSGALNFNGSFTQTAGSTRVVGTLGANSP